MVTARLIKKIKEVDVQFQSSLFINVIFNYWFVIHSVAHDSIQLATKSSSKLLGLGTTNKLWIAPHLINNLDIYELKSRRLMNFDPVHAIMCVCVCARARRPPHARVNRCGQIEVSTPMALWICLFLKIRSKQIITLNSEYCKVYEHVVSSMRGLNCFINFIDSTNFYI